MTNLIIEVALTLIITPLLNKLIKEDFVVSMSYAGFLIMTCQYQSQLYSITKFGKILAAKIF